MSGDNGAFLVLSTGRACFRWQICFLPSWGRRRVRVSFLHGLCMRQLPLNIIDMPLRIFGGRPTLSPSALRLCTCPGPQATCIPRLCPSFLSWPGGCLSGLSHVLYLKAGCTKRKHMSPQTRSKQCSWGEMRAPPCRAGTVLLCDTRVDDLVGKVFGFDVHRCNSAGCQNGGVVGDAVFEYGIELE